MKFLSGSEGKPSRSNTHCFSFRLSLTEKLQVLTRHIVASLNHNFCVTFNLRKYHTRLWNRNLSLSACMYVFISNNGIFSLV